jgi:hypothetical protein
MCLNAASSLVLPEQRENIDLGLNRRFQMILVVLADARQVRDNVDAMAFQMRRVAYSGQL